MGITEIEQDPFDPYAIFNIPNYSSLINQDKNPKSRKNPSKNFNNE